MFCFFRRNKSIAITLKIIPYIEIIKIKNIPRNIFVLIIAKTSNIFDSFFAKICVMVANAIINGIINSKENIPIALLIIKNQKENPAVTAIDLNRGEDNSNLDRIYEGYKSSLC